MQGLSTDTPTVKKVALTEEFSTFCKKTPVLIVFDFKRRKVKNHIITLYLAKIGYQGHVHSKAIADAIFHIHSPVERSFPIFTDIRIFCNICGKVGGK